MNSRARYAYGWLAVLAFLVVYPMGFLEANFDLDSANSNPQGVAYVDGKLYVVDLLDSKVYAYTAGGERDAESDFDLDNRNRFPTGITFADGRFYVVNRTDRKVYAYLPGGERVWASDFNLDRSNIYPNGINYAGERFYVVDYSVRKVFAYRINGERDPALDFRLDPDNRNPVGIANTGSQFFVVDRRDRKVYAYGADGTRAPSSDFDLEPRSRFPYGIVHGGGSLFVAGSPGRVGVHGVPQGSDPGSLLEAPPEIAVAVESTELNGLGGSLTLQVSNMGGGVLEWTASLPADVDWARIQSDVSGVGAGEIVIRYDLNGGEDREMAVTLTAPRTSNSPRSLTFSQRWFGSAACTYTQARRDILDLWDTYYFFNDEFEQFSKYQNIVLERYGNLDDMLDDLRWKPETYDRNFSYWRSREQSNLLSAAQAYAFGVRLVYIVNTNRDLVRIEVADVYRGAPASRAGLRRGDSVFSLNGKAIDGLTIAQVLDELGPNEEGHEVNFEIEKASGEVVTRTIAKALVQIPTVPEEQISVFDTSAGKVGYLHFRTFFGDANERLLEEFAHFRGQGISHLIVDLRYNGGGSVPIAYGFATLIGGQELFENNRETVMVKRVHNDLLEAVGWNRTAFFDCGVYGTDELVARCETESALSELENVVFITGGRSASASELVITALQPYENVTLVGSRTYGKPVGQYGFNFCLEDPENRRSGQGLMWLTSFAHANSQGFDDYYDGLAVDCEVADDRSQALGSAGEGRIAAALRYIETGSCEAPAEPPSMRATSEILDGALGGPERQFFGH